MSSPQDNPTPARDDTLFAIRYAVRVLERHAVLWRNIGHALKLCAVLSGTAALAALAARHPTISLAMGVCFAVLQALEVVVNPADVRAQSLAARRDYARLLARAGSLSAEALQTEYEAIVADDTVAVPRGLRELAYNDVLEEQGRDPAERYPRSAGLLGWLS